MIQLPFGVVVQAGIQQQVGNLLMLAAVAGMAAFGFKHGVFLAVLSARAILDQQRNAPPLVIVRQGHRFNVIVQDDLPVTPALATAVPRADVAEGSDVTALR